MSRRALVVVLAILFVSIIALSPRVPTARAITTIYIQADGTISPTNAPIHGNGDVYTLTGNINSDADGIVIERNNTVLDGAGYTLQGTNAPSSIGIYASGISTVTIRNIDVKAFESGIVLDAYSTFNQIIKNNVEDNDYGINCWAYSDSNSIIGNNITANNLVGIWIAGSSGIYVSENNMMGNSQYGMSLESSSNSSVFHNNFINSVNQIHIYDSISFWDNGYPSGGNYWSDYNGVDSRCGPNQDHLGADGMGDTPYTLDGNNTDGYPLMNPWIPPSGNNVAVISAVSSKVVIGQGLIGNLTVYGANRGEYTETFNVTVYANTTSLRSVALPLESEATITITISWNTTGLAKGKYTISVYAWPVPGETKRADNNFTGGWVTVAGAGDITGGTPNLLDFVPDGTVSMKDVGTVARFFLQKIPPAPSECDVTGLTIGVPDGVIDMRDIALVAKHFGENT